LADKDIYDRPQRLHCIKKGMIVSDNTELDFDMARPVLVSGNQGLQAKGVGKSFNKRRVVRNVSIGLQRGEAVGLLGPNGAGKTTTFYMLAGLLPADEGQVFIDGRDVTGMPIFQRARLGMGYLPQESSIFRGLTVEQNIRAVLETLEDHDDERYATLDDLMAEFGITHLRNTPSVSLSGGERRRLEIARALAARPTFLLLDEPLAGIDPIALGEIRDLIVHLKTHGIGVLITDHNVRETLDIVDRAYIIHDGTVLMEGTPDEVVQHSGVRQVYLGERFNI
jgi:lipopolysaccharide export system ATP-binding protein